MITNSHIRGSLSVSRNVDCGGRLQVHGDARVTGSLVVEGWIDAAHFRVPCKGLFADVRALAEAFPRPMPGWWALVGATVPAEIYIASPAGWTPTGETGGAMDIDLDHYDSLIRGLSDSLSDVDDTLASISDEVSDVRRQLSDLAHPVDVEDTSLADLVIADESRRVIAAFADGHIRTANFDSSDIGAISAATDHPVAVEDTSAADLIICDDSRRAIATFANGHIRTSAFDSATASAREFAHFSIDDAVGIIDLLKTSTASSVWNIDFFRWLKKLHDTYGATVSLYCQNSPSLSAVKDVWKTQLTEASAWLKFGFHNHTTGRAFSATAEQAASYWEGMLGQVCRFACLDSFDRCPRLDYFEGSREALVAMQHAAYGAVGYLAADDSRPSYFLSADANDWLRSHHDAVVDSATGLTFFRTDYRIDWLKQGWSSANTPNWTPQASNAYDDIETMHQSPAHRDSFRTFVFFAHEVEVLGSANGQRWVEDACRWVCDHRLAWTFPQHLVCTPKSF